MGRKKQRAINEHDIYAIKSPFDASIYVWHCVHGNHYNAYKEHVRLRKYETRELFARAEHENTYPKMYLLDTVTDTAQGAYRYCVAWTRYFLDQKMQSLSYPRTQEYALGLYPETQAIYDQINKYPLAQIFSDSAVLVNSYTRRDKTAPPTPKTEIKITVSHAEYEQIRLSAKKEDLSMSKYCKNMSLNGRIIHVDWLPLESYTKEIRQTKIALQQISFTIYCLRNYTPSDLAFIQEIYDKIQETNRELIKTYKKYTNRLLKLLPK